MEHGEVTFKAELRGHRGQIEVASAMRALLDHWFGDRMSPAFNAGIASNLVIDVFGEVDTRTDGDLRARETQARSMFVPGGSTTSDIEGTSVTAEDQSGFQQQYTVSLGLDF